MIGRSFEKALCDAWALEMFGLTPEVFDLKLAAKVLAPGASNQKAQAMLGMIFGAGTSYDNVLLPGGSGAQAKVTNPV